MLFPTQEQVAVLAKAKGRLDAAGMATVVPTFASLSAVQDKISASATLRRLGVPQPETTTSLNGWDRFPAFVKDPIGTASGGVRRVGSYHELQQAAAGRRVVVQAAAEGPLAMCQAVFNHGSIVAFHANLRAGEGANGGASHKVSLSTPEIRHFFERLGRDLTWHGALSADAILTADGPLLIDINPRLVEPQNAYLSGVDLVGPMLALAVGEHPEDQADGRPGVATHQLLLAVLAAANHRHGRRRVVKELTDAWRGVGACAASIEELTPLAGDVRAVVPVAMAALATLVEPNAWTWFASGSVAAYALSDTGWHQLLEADPT